MSKKLDSFSVEIPIHDEQKMEEFQEMMDKVAEATNDYAYKLQQELGISEWCAYDLTYLRGRSRWTQELENRLISADKAGKTCPCVTMGEESEWLKENGF